MAATTTTTRAKIEIRVIQMSGTSTTRHNQNESRWLLKISIMQFICNQYYAMYITTNTLIVSECVCIYA